MNYNLTPEEREIEERADEFVSVTGEERKEVESIITRARKSRPVNLRMSEYDLELVKRRAETDGLPYQTLINSIVHRYVTDQMVDRDEVRKILAELSDIKAK
jgi:predicted DNA binding CopG/RHH family protein